MAVQEVDQDEQEVAEVRCSESGVPLPTIPSWYANVRVKFISEAVRQKSQRQTPLPASLAESDIRVNRGVDDEDAEVEPALDEEIEDVAIDLEVDPEAGDEEEV